MLGKKSPAILALGLALSSAAVYAHKHPVEPAYSPLITIPNLRPGFELTISGMALLPAANNLNYVIYNKELPAESPRWTEKEIDPTFGPAFGIGVRYFFCGGKDLNLYWTHFTKLNSTTIIAPSSQFFLGPDYEIGPAGLVNRNAQGNSQFKYDVVNLDAGQYVDIGSSVEMRFFGGLSWASLREQVKSTFGGSVPVGVFAGPFSMSQKTRETFSGIGPRFGIGAHYNTGFYGFGLLGEAAVSALMGSPYSSVTFTGQSALLRILYGKRYNHQFIRDKGVTQVIPAFDAKLGMNYQYAFCSGSLFTLEAGYQASVYVNAINEYVPGSLVLPFYTGGIFVATMQHRQSNYSIQGPFLNARFQL